MCVVDPEGKHLGRGFWSPGSAIPVRLLTRDASLALDEALLVRRIEEAARWRRNLLGLPSREHTGYRLVNADGDELPGLTVDIFGDAACVQFGTVGMKLRQGPLVDALLRITGVTRVYEVASKRHQQREGFSVREGLLHGDGAPELTFLESGLRFTVPAPGSVGGGQKTGYYFDQRDNRRRVAMMAEGARMLDAFSYVGGFGLAAARHGAREVVCVDSSASALAAGRRIAEDNGLAARITFQRADVREALGAMLRAHARFDLVVLDPPKLAHGARDVENAVGYYRKLNAAAAGVLRKGGILVTCSCSGNVSVDTFLRAVSLGVRDAGRSAQVLAVHGAAPDHPSLAASPEGRYLKCVIARLP